MSVFKTTALIAGLLLVVLASCDFSSLKAKPIPTDKQTYVGVWTSEEVYLEIRKDGTLSYERHSGSSTTSINGPIQRFKGTNFEAGALGFNKTFKVSEPPHETDGVWTMVVDGTELVRE